MAYADASFDIFISRAKVKFERIFPHFAMMKWNDLILPFTFFVTVFVVGIVLCGVIRCLKQKSQRSARSKFLEPIWRSYTVHLRILYTMIYHIPYIINRIIFTTLNTFLAIFSLIFFC